MSEAADFDLDIDFSNVTPFSGDGMGPPEVPPGTFTFEVVEAERKDSKAGNPMIVVDVVVAEGEYTGKKLRAYYTLTEKAIGRWRQLAEACGETDFTRVRRQSVIGCRFIGDVRHEEGKEYADAQGNVRQGNTQARLFNERALEQQVEAAPPPPPAAKAKGGAVRRA